jgi:D-alanine transaminase
MVDLPDVTKIVANWNGELMPLSEVKVSVLDRAFLFGDSVYEVIRVYSSRLFRPQDHLDRLKDSLASLEIAGVDIELVRKRIEDTLVESKLSSALAYLQVTRGEAPRTHAYPKNSVPNILIYISPFDDPYADYRSTGAAAVTHPDIRWGRNDIKATSLAANCIAAEYAKKHGCLEVVFIDSKGLVTEGSHTSLFGVRNGRLLVSPSSKQVLPGITKRQVLELAKKSGIELEEVRIREDELFALDEFFLGGTPEELVPIVKVNDKPIGDGKPGPVVAKLHTAFREIIDAHARQPV